MKLLQTPWAVIVPIRKLSQAKSRLEVGEGGNRARFAVAFLTDTLSALRGCPQVGLTVLVTPDLSLSGTGGCRVVHDDGTGIDRAVNVGRDALVRHGHAGPVAVVLPDLPALDASELSAVLNSTQQSGNAFVSDADLTGTTCVTASSAETLTTAFGEGSARRHRNLGLRELLLDVPSVRQDVDTVEQLMRAHELGLGCATSELFDSHCHSRHELITTVTNVRNP
ncbi:2-phospho-L-lactate guanylyltransferase [Rhodococcus globerulus]|uniref:2-phospho-L-lactate guanylyltransferase n=1 Tax=Rhodococcus globerulus TaxID=33008 RepID=A0ABU4C304_RHOGO|nr:2-phospho-L-lactate guanylyltransferase [Rhodococcus globerulus]MDV6270656.1 2-phospho-L-lactate guanylyltransferase [Rhodococcus globerulus]